MYVSNIQLYIDYSFRQNLLDKGFLIS